MRIRCITDASWRGLRVAADSDVNSLASIIAPVLQAAYAVRADETKTWVVEKQEESGQVAVTAIRQRLYRQTVANIAIPGLDAVFDAEATPTAMPTLPTARPLLRAA